MTIQCEYCMWQEAHITDPAHGGKVTCYKCNGFIMRKDLVSYSGNLPAYFHEECYNPYEHYYGLDKPID